MEPMMNAPVAAGSIDPLSGLSVLSLFPRTIRDSADAPVPAAPKDLDSIHNIMKSLKELRSPEKLMSEAKKIVEGGANLLSDFSSFAENVSVTNDLAAKVKDRPRERRQGLGIARKKASFSLKTSISNPPAILEPTLDIDNLEDPDAFFDAYERIERAKKEIRKQQGFSTDTIDIENYKPSNNVRSRRPGILGYRRSHHYVHKYPMASENDDPWISSQETVCQDTPSSPKNESHKTLEDPDPDTNLDADLEKVELAESMKTESPINNMLEELLSCEGEDLEGQGAFNILKERLKIKTLDLENLCCLPERPDVGISNTLTSFGSFQKPRKSSLIFDSVLKNMNKKPRMEQEHGKDAVIPVSSPTPPRSPFGSISLLKKKIMQPNPLSDPFSPEDIDVCVHLISSSAQSKDKLPEQIATSEDVVTCNELESPVEFGNHEPAISDSDPQKVFENADSLPDQSRSLNANMEKESCRSGAKASPAQPNDTHVLQVDLLKDFTESYEESDIDPQNVFGNAGSLPDQSRSLNANMERESCRSGANASPAQPNDTHDVQVDSLKDFTELNEESDRASNLDIEEVTGKEDGLSEQFEDENANIPTMDASSRKNEESNNNIRKTITSNENEPNISVVGEEARDDMSTKQPTNPEQGPEVHAAKQQRRKRVTAAKRIGHAHPLTKSLAEAGTSFETGVRRSKRIKMRPLEYWKGEKFLYGYVDNSVQMIGIKYISPGKGLKVKPCISLEKLEHKMLLDEAGRY